MSVETDSRLAVPRAGKAEGKWGVAADGNGFIFGVMECFRTK